MSALAVPAVQSPVQDEPPASAAPPSPVAFHYTQSDGFVALLPESSRDAFDTPQR